MVKFHFQRKFKQTVAALSIIAATSVVFPGSAFCNEARLYKPRVEANVRAGTERSILMTEFWLPLAQQQDRVLYADARLMGDDGDNREWNFGAGYRALNAGGDAVFGVHGWLDRRRSSRGSVFHQVTGGLEYLSEGLDIRMNGYLPFDEEEHYAINTGSTTPYLADTGIYYDAAGRLVEKPLHGVDLELSIPVKGLERFVENFRVSAGGFIFDGDDTETMRGLRLRAKTDITPNFGIGVRFETDNQRGAQGFAEATLRFPFGAKASTRTLGLRGRLDESPERDIDVVTSAKITDTGGRMAVVSAVDGQAQRVFHVDNTVGGGGDGSVDRPFDTLAAANAAADRAGDIIYINRGNGMSTGMNQGLVISHENQAVIGAGSAFIYDGHRFTAGSGRDFTGVVLRAPGDAPVISNAAGDGVRVESADNVLLAGFNVSSATGHGIYVLNADNTRIENVRSNNNMQTGFYARTDGGGGRNITLTALEARNNGANGFWVEAATSGVWQNVTLDDLEAYGNAGRGVYLLADAGGDIREASLKNVRGRNNTGLNGRGVNIRANGAGSEITSVTFDDVTASGNAQQGIFLDASGSGQIGTANLGGVVASGNTASGVHVLADNGQIGTAVVAGSASGNTASGVYVQADNNGRIGTAGLTTLVAGGNAQRGVFVHAIGGGKIDNANLTDVNTTANTGASVGRGIEIRAEGLASEITSATLDIITASGNTHHGVYVLANSNGRIGSSVLTDVTSNGNASRGVFVYALGGGQIGTADLTKIRSSGNTSGNGVGVEMRSEGVGSAITSATLDDVSVSGNAASGVYVHASGAGQIGAASLSHVTARANGTNGVFIDDDTAGPFVVDLGGGGLGSAGGNRILENTGTDLRVDLDGLQLSAKDNWWGNPAGLLPGRVTLDEGSSVDTTPWRTEDLLPP